jgi:NADPH2 dehydrogenase
MPALLSPFSLGALTLRNRIVMPPMVCAVKPELHAAADSDGQVSEALLAHYRRRALGVGMVLVEATAVAASGRCWPGGLGAFADGQQTGLAALALAIHDAGAVPGIQLVHGGPQGAVALCGEVIGPSAVPPRAGAPIPRPMTRAEIADLPDVFAAAAERVVQAGFGVVEVHGAHGFLLDSFLQAARNQRTDVYGGSVDNRLRLLLEVCIRVKIQLAGRAVLACRISPFTHDGLTAEEFVRWVRELERTGVELLHLSTPGALQGVFGTTRTLGQWARDITILPRILAGGLGDPFLAQRVIEEGHAELAAVGRALLEDSEWPAHAREVLAGEE